MTVRRIYRGYLLSGRYHYLTVKWLHPGVLAIDSGLWHIQLGRLLIRASRTLEWHRMFDGRVR